MLTTEEIAEDLRVTPKTIREYIRAGWLRAVRLERGYRIRPEHYEQFLSHREQAAASDIAPLPWRALEVLQAYRGAGCRRRGQSLDEDRVAGLVGDAETAIAGLDYLKHVRVLERDGSLSLEGEGYIEKMWGR